MQLTSIQLATLEVQEAIKHNKIKDSTWLEKQDHTTRVETG